MTKSNPLEDLRNQYRSRRRRDLAARHVADAAGRYVDAVDAAATEAGARQVRSTVLAELAGAVEEWEQARRDACPVWTLRVGRLIVTHRRLLGPEPWVEDATSHVRTIDTDLDPGDPDRDRLDIANGYSLRLPGHRQALVVTVVDWSPPSLRWSTSWRRHARAANMRPSGRPRRGGYAPGIPSSPNSGRAVGDFAAMAAGDGHPLDPSGRDPRQPMNPWPR